jgi:hypothetical protein
MPSREKAAHLIGDFTVSVGSASAVLARATITQEDFRCAVEVSDEHGKALSMSEVESLADADSFVSAPARHPLTNYQLYFMVAPGSADRREHFEFPNDKEALAHAKQFVDGRALELWSGMRMVGRLETDEASDAKEDGLRQDGRAKWIA